MVNVILDNYAAHKHPKVRAWLDRHERFVFHLQKRDLPGSLLGERLGSKYRSGRLPDWLKFKNSAAPDVRREVEEDWGRSGGDENPHALWPSH